MNKKIRLLEVNVAQAKAVYPEGKYIDNDLILFEDITQVPLPNSPSRMKSLFLALCTSGNAQYTVDTKMHKVSAGDVIIISEEQVVADYMPQYRVDRVGFISGIAVEHPSLRLSLPHIIYISVWYDFPTLVPRSSPIPSSDL